jgi:hypothetical protein
MSTTHRQRLNLKAPSGEVLFLEQLSTGANLTAEGTMIMTLPILKLVSGTNGTNTVNDVANAILKNTSDISTETTNRIAADSAIAQTFTAGLQSQSASFNTAINNEATTRANDDAVLQTNINAEAAARANGDVSLQGSIDGEATARIAADAVLQTNITAEETARGAAVSAEATARAGADQSLYQNLIAESAMRNAAIAAAATVRDDADAVLQSNIDTEKARIDAILNMSSSDLDTFKEIADAYKTADSNLTTLITNLTVDFNALKLVVDTLASNHP